MEIAHDFTIAAPLPAVWEVLSDPRRAVSALPGASITELNGEDFAAELAIKLGPMNLRYGGRGTMRSDAADHRIVISGNGIEQRGGGTVAATITAALTPAGTAGTAVAVVVDLDLTGKPAQFGRGILTEVVTRLTGIFVKRLEDQIRSGAAPAPSGTRPSGAVATPAPEALDLLGGPAALLRKYAPAIGAFAGGVALTLLATRRRRPAGPESAGRVVVVLASDRLLELLRAVE
ncbi:CoxG family protein [Nocardia aurantia]|uniref:Carbon monoxide dehydrogenase subunit G n=1 Tax=Nocardia aurantia TaxID=2585199 RepID=A0A7K0DT05_9NOCA|nr:SRPBCC family protein [Nocardia aurantia]MQY28708.1 hypothetical protein [Nocardia aurantia]